MTPPLLPGKTRRWGRWARATSVAAAAVLVLSACGAEEAVEQVVEAPISDADSPPVQVQPQTVEEVFAALDGLEGAEREDALLAMARKEGRLTWFTSLTDNEAYVKAFEARYGIIVDTYRGNVDEVRERVLEEDRAGRPTMDVINMNDRGMYQLDDAGMFAPLLSPTVEVLPEANVADNWVWGQALVLLSGWNTNLVPNPPSTWEELLTDFAGQLALEPRSYFWMASLVEQYFVAELGYSEEAAIQLFKTAAVGSRAVQGNPTLFQYVVAGEMPITAHSYNTYFERLEGQGAPIAWKPAIEPIPTGGHGLAINRAAPNPASAVLWFEWFLTDGQVVVAARGNWTSNPNYATPEQNAFRTVTFDRAIVEDSDRKWRDIYAEVIAQTTAAQ